jgi:hypothetical protein
MRKTILAVALLALGFACGGGSGQTYNLTGTAAATGTVGGQTMTAPADAISNIVSQGSSSAATILISTLPNLCTLSNARQKLKNAKSLAIVIGTQSGTSVAAPAVGTYTVYSQTGINTAQGNAATALFASSDVNCNAAPIESTSGSINLTRVDATGYTGTYTIHFSGTDQLSGNFNTGSCSAFPGTSTTTCPP